MEMIQVTENIHERLKEMAVNLDTSIDDCAMELLLFGLDAYKKFSRKNAEFERNYEEDDFMDADFYIEYVENPTGEDYLKIQKEESVYHSRVNKADLKNDTTTDKAVDAMWRYFKAKQRIKAFCRLYDDGKFQLIKTLD